jgi:hypothetical protein
MKKIFLLGLIAMIAFTSCTKSDDGNGGTTVGGPQITATAFVNSHTAGSKLNGYRLDSGIIAFPVAGSGLTYNYANVPTGTPWSDTLKTPAAAFAGATYMSGANLNLFGQSAYFFRYFKVDNSSWTILGDAVSAINVTIPSTGTLTSNAQNSAKSPAQLLANFPINYADSFQQTSTSVLNFNATATVSGFAINGPVAVSQTTTTTSKNFAWGTLNIKGYSTALDCVVQKYTTSVKTNATSTNVLLNSVIPQVLSSFQIDPNTPVVTTSYRFWAAGKGLVMTLNADGTANVTTGL